VGSVRVDLHSGRVAATIENDCLAYPQWTATSMRATANSPLKRDWVFWSASLMLVLALFVGVRDRSQSSRRDTHHSDSKRNFSFPGSHVPAIHPLPAVNSRLEVRRYIMDSDGDHSLDDATVIEQGSAGSTRYTVQLHLASGVEQSVVVAAPPGGLQLEMRDMTGDRVPNDLILRPTLIRDLPTVLVNDGHNHFAVAISGTHTDSFSSNTDLGSQSHEFQTFAVMISSGFKSTALPIRQALFHTQYSHGLAFPFSLSSPRRFSHASSSGRAPPTAIAI
jgi:hypothetical protein